MAEDPEFNQQAFAPLNVKCNDSDCNTGRHAFSPDKKKRGWAKSYEGQCRDCGVKLVDWDRTKARDLRDVEGVFRELQHELIRHVFFHAEFDEKSKAQAAKLGRDGLRAKVRPYLEKKIGRAESLRGSASAEPPPPQGRASRPPWRNSCCTYRRPPLSAARAWSFRWTPEGCARRSGSWTTLPCRRCISCRIFR